ncbi:MICAL-like protein 2 [Argonauta hians]
MSQAKIRALQQWCKNKCDGYRDVKITNMTTSWKDGLAFCALIHYFRPDLINFDGLSKEDVLHNNELAFSVAEQLGIPALLDAEDMEALPVPDKLSIITYVASLHNYFKDKERMAGLGLQQTKPPASIGLKRYADNESGLFTSNKEDKNKKANNMSPAKAHSAGDYCELCKDKVYLIEKHTEDGKMYHRSCYRKSHMSPTSKILTDYTPPKQIKPSTISINSIDKTTSKNIMNSNKTDNSDLKSSRIKGKIFDKKKDQIKKAEEKLKIERQQKKEFQEPELNYVKRQNNSSALKAHLKNIDSNAKMSSKNMPTDSTFSPQLSANGSSKELLHNQPYRDIKQNNGSEVNENQINGKCMSGVSVQSDEPDFETPKLMNQVSSRTMTDNKMQATRHNKSVTNLSSNGKEQAVSNLLKSLAGIRDRGHTVSKSSSIDYLSPSPTRSFTSSNIELHQNINSIKSPSIKNNFTDTNSQNNLSSISNNSKIRNYQDNESKSGFVQSNTNIQNSHHSVPKYLSRSQTERSHCTASSVSVPKTNHRSSIRAPLPSILERIQRYSNVASGIEDPPDPDQHPNTDITSPMTDIPDNPYKTIIPLDAISENPNSKPHQLIQYYSATEVNNIDSDNASTVSNIKPLNVQLKSTEDYHSTPPRENSSINTRRHLETNDTSSKESGVICTKLHMGHISTAKKGSSNNVAFMPTDDRVNPIPKPNRMYREEISKENKENPSQFKNNTEHLVNTDVNQNVDGHLIRKVNEVKTDWQLEAKRRIAARNNTYIDPEVYPFKSSDQTKMRSVMNEDVDTAPTNKKRIPVTRTWTFSVDSLPEQEKKSPTDSVKKYSSSEIPLEVVDIDAKLRELELKGRELEDIIRATISEDEYDKGMTEWFNIINEKNELVRKENYLVCHLQEQELLDEQSNIDQELIEIQNSPGKRTKKIKKREKELIKKKIDVVNQRNIIVETIEQNRLRYQEEDQGIKDMLSKKGFFEDD